MASFLLFSFRKFTTIKVLFFIIKYFEHFLGASFKQGKSEMNDDKRKALESMRGRQ